MFWDGAMPSTTHSGTHNMREGPLENQPTQHLFFRLSK